MGLFAIINLLSTLLPALISAMKTVEVFLPESGSGAKKLDMVIEMMRGAQEITDASKNGIDFEKLVPVIGKLAGHVVSHFNEKELWDKPVVIKQATAVPTTGNDGAAQYAPA